MAGAKPGLSIAADVDPATADVPVGGYVCSSAPITFDADRPVTRLKVRNSGDRPIQVGSHFHFFEVNPALEFDRGAAFGLHLNIPSSTATRFEPGESAKLSSFRMAASVRFTDSTISLTVRLPARMPPRASPRRWRWRNGEVSGRLRRRHEPGRRA